MSGDTSGYELGKIVSKILTSELEANSPKGGKLSYQWYRKVNSNDLPSPLVGSSEQKATYDVTSHMSETLGYKYYCVVVTNHDSNDKVLGSI